MMNDPDRGTGRTTRALEALIKNVIHGPEPRLGFYVTHGKHFDDYCFRVIARLDKDNIKQYSMANRMILFKNDGRIRFINWDTDLLAHMGKEHFRVAGYRADTPVVWDHHAEDLWLEREIARNRPQGGRPEKRR